MKSLVYNKRAKFDYFLEDKYEAGMVLTGAEVKSIREGHASLQDSFVRVKDGQAYLINAFINPYNFADNRHNDPRRERKLLLHKKQISDLQSKSAGKNTTIVPVSFYDKNNTIKVEIAVGKGKKQFDKRASIKKRDLDKRIQQEMKIR
ncbi:MAG: SsrA-binding protein SmpB [bacterium]|nr:SsrA-binding protein SmpB [bacterium]